MLTKADFEGLSPAGSVCLNVSAFNWQAPVRGFTMQFDRALPYHEKSCSGGRLETSRAAPWLFHVQ
jgi:hypothetical protein